MKDKPSSSLVKHLSARYRQKPEDVKRWLAEGFSRPEIERACRMAADRKANPGDILAILAAGFDWQYAEKALDTIPDPDDDEEGY